MWSNIRFGEEIGLIEIQICALSGTLTLTYSPVALDKCFEERRREREKEINNTTTATQSSVLYQC